MASFRNRKEAGESLAERLARTAGSYAKNAVVLGIPRGGLDVGFPIAARFTCALEPITLRKLPLPGNDQVGFGVVTLDKQVILNREIVDLLELDKKEIDDIVEAVYAEVLRRDRVYRGVRPFPELAGRTAIIVDDGLATGYTMAGAIRFARDRKAGKIVAAVPVAHRKAYEMIKDDADEAVCLHISDSSPFAVASFYEDFHDMTDAEVTGLINEARSIAK